MKTQKIFIICNFTDYALSSPIGDEEGKKEKLGPLSHRQKKMEESPCHTRPRTFRIWEYSMYEDFQEQKQSNISVILN